MGLSENARKKRNEKKSRRRHRQQPNNVDDGGNADIPNEGATSTTLSTSTSTRPLTFEQQQLELADDKLKKALLKYGDASDNKEDPFFFETLFGAKMKQASKEGRRELSEASTEEMRKEIQKGVSAAVLNVDNAREMKDIQKEKKMMEDLQIPSSFGGSQDEGKRKKSPRRSEGEGQPIEAEAFGFANHIKIKKDGQTCVAMSLLQQHGWEKGMGLGKNLQGIAYPLEPKLWPTGVGIGSVTETSALLGRSELSEALWDEASKEERRKQIQKGVSAAVLNVDNTQEMKDIQKEKKMMEDLQIPSSFGGSQDEGKRKKSPRRSEE